MELNVVNVIVVMHSSQGFKRFVTRALPIPTEAIKPTLSPKAMEAISVRCIRPSIYSGITKKWLAPILGALWGLVCLTGIGGINAVLVGMPVDGFRRGILPFPYVIKKHS